MLQMTKELAKLLAYQTQMAITKELILDHMEDNQLDSEENIQKYRELTIPYSYYTMARDMLFKKEVEISTSLNPVNFYNFVYSKKSDQAFLDYAAKYWTGPVLYTIYFYVLYGKWNFYYLKSVPDMKQVKKVLDHLGLKKISTDLDYLIRKNKQSTTIRVIRQANPF